MNRRDQAPPYQLEEGHRPSIWYVTFDTSHGPCTHEVYGETREKAEQAAARAYAAYHKDPHADPPDHPDRSH